MSDEDLFSIREVSESFGLSVPTLRYYEEQGLVEPTRRIGRVRYYDRQELLHLAYALLWHREAGMSIEQTRTIMTTRATPQRHALIEGHIDAVTAQITRLREARETLEHLLICPSDDPLTCPSTGAELRRRVAEAVDPGTS